MHSVYVRVWWNDTSIKKKVIKLEFAAAKVSLEILLCKNLIFFSGFFFSFFYSIKREYRWVQGESIVHCAYSCSKPYNKTNPKDESKIKEMKKPEQVCGCFVFDKKHMERFDSEM